MKKVLITLAMSIVLVVALAAPASAYTGNGVRVENILYNGRPFQATLATQYTEHVGARIMLACSANIRATVNSYSAEFYVSSQGIVPKSGTVQHFTFTPPTGTTRYTSYIAPGGPEEELLGFRSITASATFHGDSDYTFSVYGY